jgi:hypothetical protein
VFGWRTRYRPQDHHDDFFTSGAGLYSFCISLRSASNALPAGRQICHKATIDCRAARDGL